MGKRRKTQKKSEKYGYVDPYEKVTLLNIDEKEVRDGIKEKKEYNKKLDEEYEKAQKAKLLEEQKKYEEDKKHEEDKKPEEENDEEMLSCEEIKINSNKGTSLKDDFFEKDTKEETKDEYVSQEKQKCEKSFSIFDISIFSDDEEKERIELICNNNN